MTSNKDYVLALYHQQSVKDLFDEYAETFDDHLQNGLRYNVPSQLYECWMKHFLETKQNDHFDEEEVEENVVTLNLMDGAGQQGNGAMKDSNTLTIRDEASDTRPVIHCHKVVQRCLDLGCGTGLAGAVFRNNCTYLEGVDLSHNMCRQAKKKQIYDRVVCGTLLSHMKQQPADSFDLILSADVFMYVLDLKIVLDEIHRIMTPRYGCCVFSTESFDDDDDRKENVVVDGTDPNVCRRPSERFAHKRRYIIEMAVTTLRWKLVSVTHTALRMDENIPIMGDIFVFQKGSSY